MDMLVGNHDTATKDLSTHSLHWLEAISFVRVIDKPTHNDGISRGPNGFSFLPYTEDTEVLKKFLADAGEYCFMHQGMVDVPMASGFVINEIMNHDMIPDHVRHVFTGHYHPFHTLPKATTVGSVMQHTWADQGDTRGFLVYDTDTGAIKQINTHAPRFKMLDMSSASNLSGYWGSNGYVKNSYIRVHNFNEASMETLRKEILAAGALSVEFVIKPKAYKSTVVKAISGKGLSVPELVREYENEHSVSAERRNIGKELMQ
jgi:DNA repair exonuclease SbcCD nuclease subunit